MARHSIRTLTSCRRSLMSERCFPYRLLGLILFASISAGGCDTVKWPQGKGTWTGELSTVDVVDDTGLGHRWFVLYITSGSPYFYSNMQSGALDGTLAPLSPVGMRAVLWTQSGDPLTLEPGERPSSLAVTLNSALIAGRTSVTLDGQVYGRPHSRPSTSQGGIFYNRVIEILHLRIKGFKLAAAPATSQSTH